jgi:hypothetical protein
VKGPWLSLCFCKASKSILAVRPVDSGRQGIFVFEHQQSCLRSCSVMTRCFSATPSRCVSAVVRSIRETFRGGCAGKDLCRRGVACWKTKSRTRQQSASSVRMSKNSPSPTWLLCFNLFQATRRCILTTESSPPYQYRQL